MARFYRSYHHDIPIKEESSVNLGLLLLNGTGAYPRALRVCACVGNYIVKIWHAEESLPLKI